LPLSATGDARISGHATTASFSAISRAVIYLPVWPAAMAAFVAIIPCAASARRALL